MCKLGHQHLAQNLRRLVSNVYSDELLDNAAKLQQIFGSTYTNGSFSTSTTDIFQKLFHKERKSRNTVSLQEKDYLFQIFLNDASSRIRQRIYVASPETHVSGSETYVAKPEIHVARFETKKSTNSKANYVIKEIPQEREYAISLYVNLLSIIIRTHQCFNK